MNSLSTRALGSLAGALRSVRRTPGLSAVVVLTLAVGIGANVALFSLLRGVVLRPLPFPEADRLVQLWETNPSVDDVRHGPSPWNVSDWERDAEGFEAITSWYLTSGTFRTDEWVEELRSAQVTASFFTTLGVEPALGRSFRPEEVTLYGPVMLSHRAWQRLFGGDSTVVGRTIEASGERYEIAGVMPSGFTFPDPSVQVWVAWNMPAVYAGRPEVRTWRFLEAVGRLAPGVDRVEGERALDAVASNLSAAFPEANAGWGTEVTSLHEEVVGESRVALWAAFGAVLFVLLIACANVANLLLAQVPARSREVAIRSSLGASPGRVARELLGHYATLAAVAGVLGLVLGELLLDVMIGLNAGGLPRLADVRIDGWVVAFTVGVSFVTALLFGGAPALQVLRGSTTAVLRDGTRTTSTRGQRRLREGFIVSQVAVAIVLLAGAALFQASFSKLNEVDTGLRAGGVATFRVSLDPTDGGPGTAVRYYEQLVARLAGLPGVEAVGAAQTLPMSPVAGDFQRPYRPSGSVIDAADAPAVQMRITTPGYREAVGMTLLSGDDLPAAAGLGDPLVALVNRTLADRLWPGRDPIGESFEIDFREGWQPYRVVGVVQDVRHEGPRRAARPEVFLSHRQVPYLAMTMVARTTGDPSAMAEVFRRAVLELEPAQPAHDFASMQSLAAGSVAQERFLALVFAVFAAVSLLLAATGIYGVIAYVVSHQRRDIGIRMALGASRPDVLREVAGRSMAVAGLGVLLGASVVVLAGPFVESALFGVSATDPVTLAAVSLALLAVAGLAAFLPARRAASIAPVVALRSD